MSGFVYVLVGYAVCVTVVCVGLCWGLYYFMLVCAPKCGTAVARGVVFVLVCA